MKNKPPENQGDYAEMSSALNSQDIHLFIGRLNGLLKKEVGETENRLSERILNEFLSPTFEGLGLDPKLEVRSGNGRVRIDAVVYAEKCIYLIECKLDKTASLAVHQISEGNYGQAFLNQKKPLIALGINFSSKTNMVNDWIAEPYQN